MFDVLRFSHVKDLEKPGGLLDVTLRERCARPRIQF